MGYEYKDLYEISIRELDLTPRTYNCLASKGIKTVGELFETKETELLKIRNFGMKCLEEIVDLKEKLKNNGFEVKQLDDIKLVEELKVVNVVLNNIEEVDVCDIKYYINGKLENDLQAEDLQLSARAFNCLRKLGIGNVSKLLDMEYQSFTKARGVGEHSVNEIINKLKTLCVLNNDTRIITKSRIYDIVEKHKDGILTEKVLKEIDDAKDILDELIADGQIYSVDNKLYTNEYSIIEYVENLPEGRNKQIIIKRLDGLTLQEIGDEYGLSKERVRQVCEKLLNRNLHVCEDKYSKFFEKYDVSKSQFVKIFDTEEYVYNYLNEVYIKGKEELENVNKDNEIDEEIVLSYNRVNKLEIDGEFIKPFRIDLIEYVLKKYCTSDTSTHKFKRIYDKVLRSLGLENDPRYTIDGRYRSTTMPENKNLLWKHHQKLRYYDISKYNLETFVNRLNLKQYKDIEISTLKLYRENSELMKEYDIRDEYELHNLLRKTPDEYLPNEMKFSRMPMLIFGNANKEKQIKELLFELAPIGKLELAVAYEDRYGMRYDTLLSTHLKCVSQYMKNGCYVVK